MSVILAKVKMKIVLDHYTFKAVRHFPKIEYKIESENVIYFHKMWKEVLQL